MNRRAVGVKKNLKLLFVAIVGNGVHSKRKEVWLSSRCMVDESAAVLEESSTAGIAELHAISQMGIAIRWQNSGGIEEEVQFSALEIKAHIQCFGHKSAAGSGIRTTLCRLLSQTWNRQRSAQVWR